MSVEQWAQQNEPTEAERFAQVGATKAACVDAAAACVDVAGCVRRHVAGISPHRWWQDQDEGQVDSMRLDLHKVGARSRV